MLKSIHHFSAPRFAEHEKAREARAAHYLILTSGLVILLPIINNILLLRWVPVWTMIVQEFWMAVAFVLNRKGAVKLAIHLLASSLLIAITIILWTGNEGIHAPAVLAYSIVLIFVSLLLNNQALTVYTMAVLLCIGSTVAAETTGVLKTTMSSYTTLRSFISLGAGFTVVAVSLGIFAGDLRRSQQKMLEHEADLKKSDEVLQSIVEGTVYSVGEEYLRTLVAHIAAAFGVKYVLVGCLTPRQDHIRTIAAWANDQLVPNFEYSLARTPCENVVGQSICVYPTNVQRLFPEDILLAQMGVESYCGTPIFGQNGKPLGILVVLDDKPMQEPDERVRAILTIFAARAGAELERMKADEALLKSEEKFSTVFHSSPVVISLCRASDMRYLEINETFSRVTGYTAQEVIGKTILEVGLLVRPERLQDFLSILHTERKVRNFEFDARMKDGRIRRGLISSDLIEIGSEVCVLSVSEDITERRAAEEVLQRAHDELEKRVHERTAELEMANKELEAFSYSVSHDLQSPLRSINAFTQYVLEDYGNLLPLEAKEDLGRVRRGGQDMQRLIEDLLLFSRSSRQPIQKSPLDVTALVRETYDELMQERDGRAIEFNVGDLQMCLADRVLLKQVFRNLLGNALKFTSKRERSVINVDGVCRNGEIVYAVHDNGAGFDMKYVDKLFAAFQRLHRSRDFQGTGLGLSIVQRIVERHGGHVWAEGKIDEGATFYFALPCG